MTLTINSSPAIKKPDSIVPRRSLEQRKRLKQHIPELIQLERLIKTGANWIDAKLENSVEWRGETLPIYSLTLGCKEASAPALILTAGLHGIERIGTDVLLSWLQTILERLRWDEGWQQLLENIQLVLVPIVNPAGMYANRRSNGAGIDLNRNAPVDALDGAPWLGGGHRISRHLPWYRGPKNTPMQLENSVLEDILQRRFSNNALTVSLDIHSGFGLRDSIWLPYAHRRQAIDNISSYVALKLLWERGHPQHTYVFEPQSNQYLSHGDLWDYLYLRYRQQVANDDYSGGPTFMPLTLELGSWNWVRKSPLQLLKLGGLFNPHKHHRRQRVLRRHLMLLDFLCAATRNGNSWLPEGESVEQLRQVAESLWFKGC